MTYYFNHDGQHNFALMTTACDRALSDILPLPTALTSLMYSWRDTIANLCQSLDQEPTPNIARYVFTPRLLHRPCSSIQAWINTNRNRNRPRFRFHLWNGQTCRCVCLCFSVWIVSDKLMGLFLFKYLTATIKGFLETRPRDSRVVTSYSRRTSNLL